MSLRLRRASDQYPRACWEPSNDNLVVVSGHTVVGSFKMQIGGTTGDAGWQENLAAEADSQGPPPASGDPPFYGPTLRGGYPRPCEGGCPARLSRWSDEQPNDRAYDVPCNGEPDIVSLQGKSRYLQCNRLRRG